MKIVLKSIVVIWVIFAVSCVAAPAAPAPVPAAVQEVVNTFFEPEPEVAAGDLILEGAKPYKVAKGDTLSKLAGTFYGQERIYFFPIIKQASGNVVLDPDVLSIGMDLTVPDLNRNLNVPASKAYIKNLIEEIARGYDQKGDSYSADKLREFANGL
ncbi:hypothetical protein FACS189468_3330 [Spirochaetia bacterium]|nr:hypothetical protein FACS189468_3330 [Spirochaetia bacterium]